MKRNEPTIVVKATQTVDGFAKVYKKLQQQVVLRGQSKSTFRLIGQNKRAILLPSLKEEFKLPVIFTFTWQTHHQHLRTVRLIRCIR